MQVTALQIASLKKVNKRSQIMLLDKNGSTSRVIAKELARKGFKKIRVIQVSEHPALTMPLAPNGLLCPCVLTHGLPLRHSRDGCLYTCRHNPLQRKFMS